MKKGRFLIKCGPVCERPNLLSKHWQGAYELRVRMIEKCYHFMRLGVKKVIQNEEKNINDNWSKP